MTEEEFMQLVLKMQKEIEYEIIKFLKIYYLKPYTLESRIKTPEKIKMKQEYLRNKNSSRDNYHTPDLIIYDVPDLIGFRISADSEEDVKELIELFANIWARPLSTYDFFNNPKPTGFKAVLSQYVANKVPYEIQIMTTSMKNWTNETHEEHNKRKYEEVEIDKNHHL